MKPLSAADVALSKANGAPDGPMVVRDVTGRPVAVWTGPVEGHEGTWRPIKTPGSK